MRLVAEAQSSKSRLQMLSDRAAFYLTIIAVVTGGITLATWLTLSDASFAINRMVAVLVIACPHALGLAIPLVASISTTKAARNGLLIKQRMALEAARNIDIVLFDKTGTLTKGEFGVDSIVPTAEISEVEVLQIAASVNKESEHPIARAIVNEAKRKNVALSSADSFQRIAGKGAKAVINGGNIFAGSEALLNDYNLSLDGNAQKRLANYLRKARRLFLFLRLKKLLELSRSPILSAKNREKRLRHCAVSELRQP